MNFFQKLSYKQKNRLIISVAVIFLFVVYNMGIKKTLAKYEECRDLENKTRLAINAPSELVTLQKRFDAMQKSLENYNSSMNIQQSLLGIVSKYCSENNLVVKDFIQPAISTRNDVTMETNSFEVEGAFVQAVRLVYNLEQVNKLGRVASVDFSLKRDYAAKSNNLATTVYIQNIKKVEHEK